MAKTTERENGEPKQRRRPGRVPVACAECRRLKLRCDRKVQVPCESCIKRGCSAICPEGSLVTGRGNRLVLADAEETHKKIERLQSRCAALEDALRVLQAAVSDLPHPLLREDSMSVSPVETRNGSPSDGSSMSQEEEEILDAFGTLTLGVRGDAKFFGQTSRSEYLIHAPTRNVPCLQEFPGLSQQIVHEAAIDISLPCIDVSIHAEIIRLLPTLSQACRLCEIFMEYGQYIWYPIPRRELFDEILSTVYRADPGEPILNPGTAHTASILYIVFALATLFDQTQPAYSIEGDQYFLLARLCLRCAPPYQYTTVNAVQTLVYMAQYLEMSDCEPAHTASQKAWLHIGQAVNYGHSIGLHVNSSRWKLDEDATQKRARVFWQLFMQDTWISFGFGRPPSMSLSFIDCEFPEDFEARMNGEGQREWSFHAWTWQYTKLMHNVITTAFGAKAPQYSVVLAFDRKIRDFPIPDHLRHKCGLGEPEPDVPLTMQRYFVISAKESTLLSLHRPFFAQALHERPADLLRHRYGPSVMAIYRSAWRIIESARDMYKRAALTAMRLGIIWSHSLAAGIVMCLLVTRAPRSSLAASALQELNVLCDLFEQAAVTAQIASNNLDVVRKLRRRAHETYTKPDEQVAVTDELDRLRGKTQLISSAPPLPMPTEPQIVRVDPAFMVNNMPALSNIIHPTIMQDLRVFEGFDNGVSLDFPQFSFDLPSTSPLQPQMPANPEFMSAMFGQQAFVMPEPAGPPVLDATWESFVEQLGFSPTP